MPGAETCGSSFHKFIHLLQNWQLSSPTACGTSLSACEGETFTIHQRFNYGDCESREHFQHYQLWQQHPKQQPAKQSCFCSCAGHRRFNQRGGRNIADVIQEGMKENLCQAANLSTYYNLYLVILK